MADIKNLFEQLYEKTFKGEAKTRDSLKYLSWTTVVSELSKVVPDWDYEIKRYGENNLPYTYDPKTGYMVSTTITINGKTKEMWLPVMNGSNKAMLDHPYTYKTKKGEFTVEAATMFDINKAIMRCLVKNIAMFGLGLFVYKGEDLPMPTLEEALAEIEICQSDDEVVAIWNNCTHLHSIPEFSSAVVEKRATYTNKKK